MSILTYKEILGASTILLAIIGYVPYFRDIFAGRTKPHAFSWLIWAILTAIAFAAQLSDNAGAGAWLTAFTAIICLIIFIIALSYGKRNIVRADWLSLLGAGLALMLWAITKGPLLSVILVTIIDALGFIPTFRKSYNKPSEETLITYALSGPKFILATLSLNHISFITTFYPASLVVMNGLFVIMLLIRRKQLATR